MIVTLTANPSLDRTASLDRALSRGEVHRVRSVTVEPGGKGINVARVAHAAGHPVRAILPAGLSDPILRGLDELGVPYRTVPLAEGVRTNLTLTEPDGTTTKINEPGPSLDAPSIEKLAHLLVLESERADWVVLSGSLPPGVPAGWYADLVRALRPWGCRIAVDTSDARCWPSQRSSPRRPPTCSSRTPKNSPSSPGLIRTSSRPRRQPVTRAPASPRPAPSSRGEWRP